MHKVQTAKLDSAKIIADKVSGAETSIFFISVLIDVVKNYNFISPFEWKFYGIDVNCQAHHGNEWMMLKDCEMWSSRITEYVQKNGFEIFDRFSFNTKNEAERLLISGRKACSKLGSLNDTQLAKEFDNFNKQYFNGYSWGCVTFIYESVLSERLFNSLSQRYNNVPSIVTKLFKTSYQSFISSSNKKLLTIKALPADRKEEEILQYLRDYYFIDANYNYTKELRPADIQEKIKKITLPEIVGETIRNSDVQLTNDETAIVKLLVYAESIRDQRKRLNLIGNYVLSRFIDEVVKRCGTDLELCKRAYWFEYHDLLNCDNGLLSALKNRHHVSLYLLDGKAYYFNENVIDEHKEDIVVREIRGTPASGGIIKAKANIVKGPSQFNKFKQGDVLVTQMTRPDFVNIMHMASAVVTDEGGLTCHAAVIAREQGIPCIVGTKVGTRVFKDGDLIEVDANNGIVKMIKEKE